MREMSIGSMHHEYSVDLLVVHFSFRFRFSYRKYVQTGKIKIISITKRKYSSMNMVSVRGIVNAMGFFIGSLGSLIGFIIALYCDFRMQAVYALSVPVLFMLMFSFVPESPAYLYKKNKIAASIESYSDRCSQIAIINRNVQWISWRTYRRDIIKDQMQLLIKFAPQNQRKWWLIQKMRYEKRA